MSAYQSVFKDEGKLDLNYVPHTLPHRDRELRLLTQFFAFVTQTPDKMSQRVVVTGDVGTGKTVISQLFGAGITREASKHGINMHYVHVNCREYRGSFFLILQHVVSVFHPGFPKRGYSAEELLRALVQVLDEENAYVLLALDEFDSLIEKEGSDAVYKLTRLHELRPNKPQRLSLICILRDLGVIGKLDASTRSTLQSNVINLQSYSKQQLIDILNDRAALALKPQAASEETVDLIAEAAFSEGGNARFGIELLWRAGKYADAEDLGIVTPECVRRAISSIIPTVQKNELGPLGFHERLFLLSVARLFKGNEKAYVSLAEAEQAYAVVCEDFGVKPNSHTQLWKYLRVLSALGLVSADVSSVGSRGRSTLIRLPRIPALELEKELDRMLKRGLA